MDAAAGQILGGEALGEAAEYRAADLSDALGGTRIGQGLLLGQAAFVEAKRDRDFEIDHRGRGGRR